VSRKYLALDLEMNQPSGRIIQIGWAIGTLDGDEPPRTDSVLVNPEEHLTEYIIKLTGIKDEDVQMAKYLPHAFEKLRAEFGDKDLFRVPITWGGGDQRALREQLAGYHYFGGLTAEQSHNWPLARSEWDIKKIWQFIRLANGEPIQGGLAKSMTKMGLRFDGRKHNAEDDAKNTLLVARHLFKLLKKT